MLPQPSPLVRVPTVPLDPNTLGWTSHRKELVVHPANTSRRGLVRGTPITIRDGTVREGRLRLLAPVLASHETDPEEDPATPYLKQYLQESWFPAFKVGPRVKQDFVWPCYPELQAPPGTRKLRVISRIMPYRIHGAAYDYLARQNDQQIDRHLAASGGPGDLALPSINTTCDARDMRFYTQDVNFVTDITKLLMAFTFRTIARCLYMLLGIPEGEEGDGFRSIVQFKTSFEMCPVNDKNFDVISLPTNTGRTSMIILVIPPWALDNMDFISFINTGPVAPGSIDVFPADKPASAPATVWAMLWDMCSKHKCYYFAVTTYEFWAFGNFSSNMDNGYISDLFKAPVYSHNAQVERDILPSPTMTETLLFWMAACIGVADINWKPFDDKVTS